MPEFLETRLRQSARRAVRKGRIKTSDVGRYVYGAMNNMGAMHGSQETAKGKAMERKHNRQVSMRGRKKK